MSEKSPLHQSVDFVGKFAGYVVKVAAAWAIIFGIIWAAATFIFEPRLAPYTSLPSITAELADAIDFQGRELAQLREEMANILPQRPVVEYDAVRSTLFDKCAVGQTCRGEIVARRTEFGESCVLEKAQRFVRNHFGATRPVAFEGAKIQLDAEWLTIPISFELPEGVQPGLGEFFIRFTYSGCTGLGEGQTIKETSPPMKFEILG